MAWDGRWPNMADYAIKLPVCFLLFGLFDYFVARKTKARYFAIHVLANAIVVVSTLPSILFLIADPASAVQSSEFSTLAVCCNLAIHIYHVTMFNNLQPIDWLHHGLMTGIATPLTILYGSFFGPVGDGQNFFTCGLPGGIDYALLFAVKQGWMRPLVEKKWNTVLNVWVRGPGILSMCAMGFVQGFLKDPTASWLEAATLPELSLLVLMIWNAQFFTARVVGNYAVRDCIDKEERIKNSKARNDTAETGQTSEDNTTPSQMSPLKSD